MRTKSLIVVSAALLLSATANAAEKPGKPIDIKPSATIQPSGDWRERAMKSRAESLPESGAPTIGNARAQDERGDRRDGEEVGSGRLRQDRGEGSDLDE